MLFKIEQTPIFRQRPQSMKNNPKNQHWVPQFYLREFAVPETRGDGKEQVWIFSRRHSDDLETKRVSTRNVAAQNFLYSPLRKDGSRSFAGEQMLAEVDGFLSQFWPRIANGLIDWDANQGIRRGLAWFMALLLARHPDQIEVAANIQEKMLRLYESASKDEQRRPQITSIEIEGTTHDFDNSDWEAYRDATHADIQQNVVDNIRPLTIELTEHLLNKKWAIVVAPHPVFVTSDRPVYSVNSERSGSASERQERESFFRFHRLACYSHTTMNEEKPTVTSTCGGAMPFRGIS
jgi:hypothetical protein